MPNKESDAPQKKDELAERRQKILCKEKKINSLEAKQDGNQ